MAREASRTSRQMRLCFRSSGMNQPKPNFFCLLAFEPGYVLSFVLSSGGHQKDFGFQQDQRSVATECFRGLRAGPHEKQVVLLVAQNKNWHSGGSRSGDEECNRREWDTRPIDRAHLMESSPQAQRMRCLAQRVDPTGRRKLLSDQRCVKRNAIAAAQAAEQPDQLSVCYGFTSRFFLRVDFAGRRRQALGSGEQFHRHSLRTARVACVRRTF